MTRVVKRIDVQAADGCAKRDRNGVADTHTAPEIEGEEAASDNEPVGPEEDLEFDVTDED